MIGMNEYDFMLCYVSAVGICYIPMAYGALSYYSIFYPPDF